MTHEQIIEGDKALACLQEARKHLDRAMYGLGTISNEDHNRLRQVYELICRAQDVAVNAGSVVKIVYENDHKYNIQIWIM